MADESAPPHPPIRNVKAPRLVGGQIARTARLLQTPDLARKTLMPVSEPTPDFDTPKPQP